MNDNQRFSPHEGQQYAQAYEEDLGGGVNVTYNNPQRLNILTLLYNAFSFIPQIILPAFFVIFRDDGSDGFWILITVVLGIFALPSMYLGYMNFYYMFTETDFVVYSGILSKKQRSVPYRRIQNVSMKQNILMKAFDLVAVSLETAGDQGKEAELRYVKSEEYERIKSIIGRKTRQAEQPDVNTSDVVGSEITVSDTSTSLNESNLKETSTASEQNFFDKEDEVIYEMTLAEMIKFGAMRIRPTVLVIIAWVWGISQQFLGSDFLVEYIEALDVDTIESQIDTLDWLTLGLYVIGSVFVAFFISWIIDILLGLNMLWGFKLRRNNDKLFSERGLISTVKKTVPLKKLQLAQYVTNPIKRWFGYYGLELFTAGSPMQGSGKSETKVIPLAKKERISGFMKTLVDDVDTEDLRPVSKLTIRRAAIRYFFLIAVICVGLYWLFDIWWPPIVLVPLSLLGAYVRWKYRGYSLRGNYIVIREGFFRESISIIPIKKIQNLHIYSTFFQRRLGLASFYVDTAAFSGFTDAAIIDLSIEEANQILSEIQTLFWANISKESVISRPDDTNLSIIQDSDVNYNLSN